MMQRKLGIIAVGGPLPKYLAEYCQHSGREYFVIALVGNANEKILNGFPVQTGKKISHRGGGLPPIP